MKNFTISNGLPHDITYGIFQDKGGFIWIGTDDGLAKFDGQDFKIFTIDDGLRSNFVIDIKQANNGDILLATWGGGLQIIRNDKILPIQINNDSSEKINNLQLWNDHVIVKNPTGNFLYKKTKSGYEKKLLKNTQKGLTEFKFGIYIGVREYVSIIDNNIFFLNDLNFLYSNQKPKKGVVSISNKQLKSLKYFQNKIVNSFTKLDAKHYLISEKDSVFIFTKDKIIQKAKLFIGPEQYVVKIQKLKNDYIFLLTDLKGFKNAFLFSDDFKTKTDLKQKYNIDSSISDFLIDNENNLWLTSFGNGLFLSNINEKPLQYFTNSILPEAAIYDIKEKNGIQYLLSRNYFSIIKNGNLLQKTKLQGIGKKIAFDKSGNIQVISTGLPKAKSNKNNLEIRGFTKLNLTGNKNIFVNDSIFIEHLNAKFPRYKKNIFDAIHFKDTLWFATNIGMFYYDSKKNDLLKKTIGNKELLSENIRRFIVKNDELWIATNKGLCQYKNNKINNFTKNNGLISNQIISIIKDHRQNFWIGTNKGISIFDGKNFINKKTNTGLLSQYVNTIFEDSKQQIWIGTDKGVTIIDNTKFPVLQNAPIVNVHQKNVYFTYTIISYNRSNSLVAEYRLNDSQWISLPEIKGKLNFSNEKKGDYTFQIRAKKSDGNWGYSKKYNFEITIPWHKDPLYLIIAIILVAFGIIVLILKQLEKTKKRNYELKKAIKKQIKLEKQLVKVRENIAQDFHDDFGNKLARISLLTNMANAEISENKNKLKTKLEQIENDANYLYKGTKDFIFSLTENSDYPEELATYLSDFGEDLFLHSDKKFIISKEIHENKKLPYYWSKQLIYIFKEAFTNVLKHSNGNQVEFIFFYKNDTLEISCVDNGIVDSTEFKNENGLLNMKNRAEKLGGQFEINFNKNHSTTVSFKGKTT